MNFSLLIILFSQLVASIMFAFNGASYEKVMIPLFFAVLLCILWAITDINNKMKPS